MAKYTGALARQRLNSVLANHLIQDFAANGAEVVAKLRQDKPVEYRAIWPVEMSVEEADARLCELDVCADA